MILGSHNSWSYISPKKWWMKLINFTAKCQDLSIQEQYKLGVRCFDLRLRGMSIAHGLIEYNYLAIWDDLEWLNSQSDLVYVRVIHEARRKKDYTKESIGTFVGICNYIQNEFKNIRFWCGRNLYNWNIDYKFPNEPSCEEKYSSVCSPKLIDDWFPRLFAYFNNKKILKKGTNKDILLIDFVNYGY